MKVKDLNGKEHSWNLTKYIGNERRGCSDYHKRARLVIKEIYPFDQVLEEVAIPGTTLFADFYIPKRMLMIEVQGEQHSNFVPFFHKDKQGFGKAKKRDKVKSEWCELNGITLVELSYTDDDINWANTIRGV